MRFNADSEAQQNLLNYSRIGGDCIQAFNLDQTVNHDPADADFNCAF
jgi:hypothetical protein